jgi:hypothetical protein
MYTFLISPTVLNAPPTSSSLTWPPWRVQLMKHLTMQFFPHPPVTSPSFQNILLSTLFLKTFDLQSSPTVSHYLTANVPSPHHINIMRLQRNSRGCTQLSGRVLLLEWLHPTSHDLLDTAGSLLCAWTTHRFVLAAPT